jgi:hypothetical protein
MPQASKNVSVKSTLSDIMGKGTLLKTFIRTALILLLLTGQRAEINAMDPKGTYLGIAAFFAIPTGVFIGGEIARNPDQRSSYLPVFVNANVAMLLTWFVGFLLTEEDYMHKKYFKYFTAAGICLSVLAGSYTYYINLHDKNVDQNNLYLKFAVHSF